MPRAIINQLFFIPGFFKDPMNRLTVSILINVVVETVSKIIGYEANMADIAYKIKIYEN